MVRNCSGCNKKPCTNEQITNPQALECLVALGADGSDQVIGSKVRNRQA